MDDPTVLLELAADRLDLSICLAHAHGKTGEELRLHALQMGVRDAIRQYRDSSSTGASIGAFSPNFLSAS